MVLFDDHRLHVDVNGAYLRLVDRSRNELIGQPVELVLADPPAGGLGTWWDTVSHGELHGNAELMRKDGRTVRVDYAGHPEVVTGRRLVLFVALHVGHRRRRRSGNGRPRRDGASLSDREREVVHLVALGHTAREIGDELHISHDTVRTHVRNAMSKLHARSSPQLVAIALGHGLIHAK
jgi:DNA-binding CsgD family transcriptional regulator